MARRGCVGCTYTYYVDSDVGDQAETGSGTELDPWINLNTVFNNTAGQGKQIYEDITIRGCNVVVWVKGTIDYSTTAYSTRSYLQKLYLKPWEIEWVTCSASGSFSVAVITNCVGVVWLNFDVTSTSTGSASGFNRCSSGIFNNCTGTVFADGIDIVSAVNNGFNSCHSSTFNNCTGTATAYDNNYFNSAAGCSGCHSSTFNNCVATGTSYTVHGFGFYSCYSSVFDSCEGSGTSTHNSYGYYFCYSSAYDTCTGNGYVTNSSGCRKACGFYLNSSSSFLDCSSSARIKHRKSYPKQIATRLRDAGYITLHECGIVEYAYDHLSALVHQGRSSAKPTVVVEQVIKFVEATQHKCLKARGRIAIVA